MDTLNRWMDNVYQFMQKRLNLTSRFCLLLGALFMLSTFVFPLWTISLEAPQYQYPLEMHIYSYQLAGGGEDNQHLEEINILNHYIGMQALEEDDFPEMRWMPFAFGILILLTMRGTVMGRLSNPVDALALFIYFGIFSFGLFAYRLYEYGTNLDPSAPMNMEPFVPKLIGTEQIANFTQHSYPATGTYLLVVGILFVAASIFFSRNEDVPGT